MPGPAYNPSLNPRHAVYAGSFDPVTLGHWDIIQRAAKLFERITVGVGINPEKHPLFTPQERMDLLQEIVRPLGNVTISCFEGLTVNFVRECKAAVMVRGLRTLTDIEGEFTMTLANRSLSPDIETVFLMASERYSHISSSLIKQIARFGNDAEGKTLEAFVPAEVVGPLRQKFHAR
jgi:pantetheine-phosphate adenylyltransferase